MPAVSVTKSPGHNTVSPIGVIIAGGAEDTVTIVVRKQPAADVYEIVAVPVATPVRTPVPGTMVAMAVLPLAHVPPDGVHVSVTVLAGHIVVGPPIAPGSGLTVTVRVLKQPVNDDVYVIVVVPTATVFTMPVAMPIVAIPALLLLQVPPALVLVSVMLDPMHTEPGPPINGGKSLTVTIAVVMHPSRV